MSVFNHQPTAPYRAHAIVVLGRGLEPDGSLPLLACQRVQRAAELFAWQVAPRIIFTGRCSLNVDVEPLITEAAAMAAYAEQLGLPRSVMHLEEEARDTVGNAWFTMTSWLEPNEWTSIRVVTSDFHMPRAAWVFQKVLGVGYDLAFTPAPSELDHTSVALRAREESDILTFLVEWMGTIRDGDMSSLRKLIHEQHPGYAMNPTISRAMIQERIEAIGRGHRVSDEREHREPDSNSTHVTEM